MSDAARVFLVFGGLGGLLAVVGFFLLISQPWPDTGAEAKTRIKKPLPLAGIVCLVFSFIFLLAGIIPMLSV